MKMAAISVAHWMMRSRMRMLPESELQSGSLRLLNAIDA